jgi:hypothetical protein
MTIDDAHTDGTLSLANILDDRSTAAEDALEKHDSDARNSEEIENEADTSPEGFCVECEGESPRRIIMRRTILRQGSFVLRSAGGGELLGMSGQLLRSVLRGAAS